ncbi:hypothetical protein Acor_73230 [Acrocarpospora corrugata]|uniref:Uncharacterized protein n=1 Tax=Acrocarpospora corrugata TaxID=35763 RepID=A0A5M3W862_9ACTN|nr:hypothetical protein Acor_73230 [Acrocarpospora corrugata]
MSSCNQATSVALNVLAATGSATAGGVSGRAQPATSMAVINPMAATLIYTPVDKAGGETRRRPGPAARGRVRLFRPGRI